MSAGDFLGGFVQSFGQQYLGHKQRQYEQDLQQQHDQLDYMHRAWQQANDLGDFDARNFWGGKIADFISNEGQDKKSKAAKRNILHDINDATVNGIASNQQYINPQNAPASQAIQPYQLFSQSEAASPNLDQNQSFEQFSSGQPQMEQPVRYINPNSARQVSNQTQYNGGESTGEQTTGVKTIRRPLYMTSDQLAAQKTQQAVNQQTALLNAQQPFKDLENQRKINYQTKVDENKAQLKATTNLESAKANFRALYPDADESEISAMAANQVNSNIQAKVDELKSRVVNRQETRRQADEKLGAMVDHWDTLAKQAEEKIANSKENTAIRKMNAQTAQGRLAVAQQNSKTYQMIAQTKKGSAQIKDKMQKRQQLQQEMLKHISEMEADPMKQTPEGRDLAWRSINQLDSQIKQLDSEIDSLAIENDHNTKQLETVANGGEPQKLIKGNSNNSNGNTSNSNNQPKKDPLGIR